MSNRGTHYEIAFEDYLRQRRIAYVAIDQNHKAIFSGVQLKSFDFIIYPPHGPNLLIDVKGRKAPSRAFHRHRFGQTWTTIDDIEGLKAWEQIFAPECLAAFVFAYWLFDEPSPPSCPAVHTHNHHHYAFVAVELADYTRHLRPRSPSWHTVYVPTPNFAAIAHPLHEFLPA